MREGFLYCFNTLGDARVYKIGHTRQDELAHRLKGYLGPSKPRVLVVQRRVVDSVEAERLCLALVRGTRVLLERRDMGDEWFEAPPGVDVDQLHCALALLAEVVGRAVETEVTRASAIASHETACEPRTHDAYPPGMEQYVAALDRYVANAAPMSALASPDALVDAFEGDAACPVFVEYLMWDRATRVRWADARVFQR